MPLLQLLLTVLVLIALLWVIRQFLAALELPPPIANCLYAVVVLVVILWLVQAVSLGTLGRSFFRLS